MRSATELASRLNSAGGSATSTMPEPSGSWYFWNSSSQDGLELDQRHRPVRLLHPGDELEAQAVAHVLADHLGADARARAPRRSPRRSAAGCGSTPAPPAAAAAPPAACRSAPCRARTPRACAGSPRRAWRRDSETNSSSSLRKERRVKSRPKFAFTISSRCVATTSVGRDHRQPHQRRLLLQSPARSSAPARRRPARPPSAPRAPARPRRAAAPAPGRSRSALRATSTPWMRIA